MPEDATHIEFGGLDGALYIRVRGPAAQSATFAADALVNGFLTGNPSAPIVIFDLAHAPFIDSTFAGWLLRLRRRLPGDSAGTLILAALSEPCRSSLERMRVCDLFEFRPLSPPSDVSRLECGKVDGFTPAAVRLMADAHAALAAVSEENRRIFGPIAEMLRKQTK